MDPGSRDDRRRSLVRVRDRVYSSRLTFREPEAFVDPIAHTLTGASLSASGLHRTTPLATATLVLAANAPDVDIVTSLFGPYTALAWRRGITHGIPALLVLPFLVTGLILLWDRRVRLRRHVDARPARPRAVFALSALGVATHPALDWLNTYGMRWLVPLDGRWSYGDALFIVDPWLWLLLGGATFLAFSRSLPARTAWALLAAGLSGLVLLAPIPPVAKLLWGAGITALIGLRARRAGERGRSPERTWQTRMLVAAAALYVGGMVALAQAAERAVRTDLARQGVTESRAVMVAPVPANPLAGTVVAELPGEYLRGSFHWLRDPRFRRDLPPLARGEEGPSVAAARSTAEARSYLVWARFPFYRVETLPGGYRVRIGDARFPDPNGRGGLGGLTVVLDRDLRPLDGGGCAGPVPHRSAGWERTARPPR